MKLTTLILILVGSLAAQAGTYQGKIVDSGGEPLVGVQVFLKDSYNGTTTNVDGEFSITLSEGSGVLTVSYIGYKTQEVTVSSSAEPLLVTLEVDILKGDEVLVTGLASSVKRRNAANAVASVSGEELVGAPVQTLDGALNGKFAGVRVRHNSGAPGGGMSVNLRGVSTITGETQPLYVIDGVIVNNSTNQSGVDVISAATGAGSARPQGQPANRISDFNPNDIESIEVLKGASAAAIYGAKATNGVIIITTKKGTAGKTRINFSQKMGTSTILKTVGTRDFTYDEAVAQYGKSVADLGTHSGGKYSKTYDYEDMLYGNSGALKETSLSVSGGSDQTQFYLSTQFLDEESIVKNRYYERVAGRLNLNHRISDKFKLASTVYLARTKSDRGITGNDNTNKSYNFSFGFTPNFVDITQNSDGSWPDNPTNPSNPLHTVAVLTNEETVNRATGSLSANYTVFRTGSSSFSLNSVFSGDYVGQLNEIFSPPDLQDEKSKDNAGQSVLTNTHSLNTNVNLNGVFRMNISGLKSTTTAGLSYETLDWNYSSIMASGMVVTQTNIDQSASTSTLQSRRIQQDRGVFVQEEVQLGDAVYAAVSLRGDKSSTLGKTDEYNWYPKVAASYQFGSIAGVFDELKVRAASGQTGNLPPPTAKYTSMSPYNIGGMGGLVSGGVQGYDEVEPERTAETEFGVDFSALAGMVGVEFTVYKQKIEGLLLQVEEAPSTGFSSKWANAGKMETSGTELGVTLNPLRSKSLNWLSRTTYYQSKAKITELSVDPYNTGGFATFLGGYRIEEGWDPHTIIGSEMEADGTTHVKLGSESPDFMMGFNNRFSFGDFSVVAHVDWKNGGQNVNLQQLIADLGGTTVDFDDKTVDPDGTLTNGAYRLGNLGAITRPYIQDAGYVRLSELSLSYNLPKSMLGGAAVERVQVSFTGRNLWQTTPYAGWNPDVSQFGNVGVGGSVDTGPYPMSKSMYLSVNISL